MMAGQLNRRITVQKKAVTYDSYGAPAEAWTDAFSVWAGVVTTGGGEFYAAQKLHADTKALFKTRYTTGITVQHRIVYMGRVYEILAINDVNGERKALHISAREVE